MKCEFVMAMLHNPEIVFLDEPTIGLDVIAKAKIREVVSEMNRNGTTFILTTHDLEDVEQLAQEVIVINHGKKVFDDSLQNLKSTLGNKKIVNLSLAKPFRGENMGNALGGIPVIPGSNECEISLEIDLDKQDIKDFLSSLNGVVDFKDISIKELPMETIITRIYSE